MSSDENLKFQLQRWLQRNRKQGAILEVPELSAALGTDIGSVRRENQDRATLARFNFGDPKSENFHVAILCDGIGGTANGGASAEICTREVLASLSTRSDATLSVRLINSINAANQVIHESYGGKSGTTVVAVLIAHSMIVAASVGDSRLYHWEEKKLVQISTDDTIAGELSRLKAIDVNELPMDSHSRSLAQFVGMGDGIEPRPYFFKIVDDHSFVLTSDGAHRWPGNFLSSMFESAPNLTSWVSRIINVSRWTGGHDNATVICIQSKVAAQSEVNDGVASLELWDPFGKCEILNPFPKPRQLTVIEPRIREAETTISSKSWTKPPGGRRKKYISPEHRSNTDADPKTEIRLSSPQRKLEIEISNSASLDPEVMQAIAKTVREALLGTRAPEGQRAEGASSGDTTRIQESERITQLK